MFNIGKYKLGDLINLISGFGSEEHREKAPLGRVYEYLVVRYAESYGPSSNSRGLADSCWVRVYDLPIQRTRREAVEVVLGAILLTQADARWRRVQCAK